MTTQKTETINELNDLIVITGSERGIKIDVTVDYADSVVQRLIAALSLIELSLQKQLPVC